MDFRILGPLEVVKDGTTVDLGPLKQRSLLALLLLHPNRVVSTDRILEELWGDAAAGKENALWVYVSRLRSALEPSRDERGQSSVLLTRDHGYVLSVDPASIDAQVFESAAHAGRSLVKSDPTAASETLGRALALWRGAALQDFAYDEFARAEIARLEDLRLNAVEDRVEADLRRGLSGELVGEVEMLAGENPLRERPVGQLMLVLYRAGRQAEALRAFERYRRAIGDELGIEPSPELRRLQEQILLHDTRLKAPPSPDWSNGPVSDRIVNPFKGLYSFAEPDAGNFFGRERLVAEVVSRLTQAHLIALVGPSGSGKSSVVRAGLVPALRKGAVPGSERWLIATMVPGAHPFVELEAALIRASLDPPDSLTEQLERNGNGLLRAALRVLPDDTARLLLVIDQFEELFTLVDDPKVCQRFLTNLETAIDDPHGRVRVVLTMRADAYHRPLAYPEFGTRLGAAVVNVVPLTPDELEAAAQEPVARLGVSFEPALLAELLSDVVGEPGALPIFQYTLWELFNRRVGDTLSVDTYRAMGGVRGALSRRADEVYAQLEDDQQAAAKQLFLRLVTITEHDDWTRRRVEAAEIVALDVDVVAMEAAIDYFGRQRFLAFDRDPASGAPTVEVAHEALLWEWDQLREWIQQSRQDVRRHATLRMAMDEWLDAGRDPDYLLSGSRLREYERWSDATPMKLTTTEKDYLDSSFEHRQAAQAQEDRRQAREARLRRRARRRLWGLVAVVTAVGTVAAGLILASDEPLQRVGLVYGGRATKGIAALTGSGLDEAHREVGFKSEELTPPFSDLEGQLRRLAAAGTDLIIIAEALYSEAAMGVAPDFPDTTWAYLDLIASGVATTIFAEHQGAYLVGAAAALTSQTGTLGFLGGYQYDAIERFRAGYEAGARAVKPDIKILATYVSLGFDGFSRDDLARAAAEHLYAGGADIVFHAAGVAGFGVFEAARAQTTTDRRLWAIGADSDQYLDVDPRLQPYVLTSMTKKFDVAVRTVIKDFMDGGLEPAIRVMTLADGGLDFSTTGGFLSDRVVAALEKLKGDIIAGRTTVPISPTGTLDPPIGVGTVTPVTVTFDGTVCRSDGPPTLRVGEVIRVDLINTSAVDALAFVQAEASPIVAVGVPAQGHGRNSGYASVTGGGRYQITCTTPTFAGSRFVPGPNVTATSS